MQSGSLKQAQQPELSIVSRKLADKLMDAENAEAFFQANQSLDWRAIASLKSEVDRLVGCDLTAAHRLAHRIEEIAELSGDRVSRAFAAAARGRVLHNSGRFGDANRLYDRAATIIARASLHAEAAWIRIHQVYALTQMGRYERALETAQSARRLLGRENTVRLAQLETNVGTIYYRLDRYQKALTHYERARALLSRSGDRSTRAFVDFSRSNILTDTDRPTEALVLLESAARAWRSAGLKLLAAQARFHIAYLKFLRGSYNSALAAYHQVREELQLLGGHLQVAWCNQEIAEILLALNSFDEAAESASAAHAAFADLGMPYESAQAAVVQALSAMGLETYEKARGDLARARRAFRRAGNKTLVAVVDSYAAELALREGRLPEAIKLAGAAHRVFSRHGLVLRSAHLHLVQARARHARGDHKGASLRVNSALRLIAGRYAPTVEYQCHHLLGRIAKSRGQARSALAGFRKAVRVIDRMRVGISADQFKATFLRDKIPVYEDAISACLDQGGAKMTEEAFRLVESSKSRALAELLARYIRQSPSRGDRDRSAETRARLQKLVEDLNWYTSQAGIEDDKGEQRSADVAERYHRAVVRCENQIARLFRLAEDQDDLEGDARRLNTAGTRELLEALEPGETAIEYFTTGDQMSAFVASEGDIEVVRNIASRSAVDRAMIGLRFQFEKFNYGAGYVEAYFGQLRRSAGEHLSQLYKLVFEPLAKRIKTDRLVVIPHASLHYVPFHALANGAGPLIDMFEISRAPSAAVLNLCRRRPVQNRGDKFVALGIAERTTPHIENEISQLADLFPDAIALTGNEATLSNLMKLAPRARFLHLASHGYFRRDNPMFSFLKLADSRLNFYSLLDLKLNAEMVTLSACHTGVNMVFPGDELHGLMRGFLYAGAPSLVASLWAVSDRSTAEFMREMYSRIHAGDSKRTALRKAQLAIKDAYGHPYYWAPFVLMGSPN